MKEIEQLYEQGELDILEFEFGRFLISMDSSLNSTVIMAGICCIRNQIKGNICISLEELIKHPLIISVFGKLEIGSIRLDLQKSSIVGVRDKPTPLILEDNLLYTQKFWAYERELSRWVLNRASVSNVIKKDSIRVINGLFGNDRVSINLQEIATKISLIKDLIIISGGPGTGKTFTVEKIIQALILENPDFRIALAAPTGKAAQRLSDSLDFQEFSSNIQPPITIHRLLGAKGDSGTFKFNSSNPLPFDIIVIDEASMLDLNIWIQLIRAIPKSAKLILLGDKNQLASVEAGSILGDITKKADNTFSKQIVELLEEKMNISKHQNPLNDCIIELSKSYRFNDSSGIDNLAKAINKGDENQVLEILFSDKYPEVNLAKPTNAVIEETLYKYAIDDFKNLGRLNEYHILCAIRKGPFGVNQINFNIEKRIKKEIGISSSTEWFEGRRILFTKNNETLNFRNGEVAVCDKDINSKKYFLNFNDGRKLSSISRIRDFEPAFATTIHKSQGSEYNHVAIILPNDDNLVLSKELLYTAVTRARQSVLIVGTPEIITSTVKRGMARKSGLDKRIWAN